MTNNMIKQLMKLSLSCPQSYHSSQDIPTEMLVQMVPSYFKGPWKFAAAHGPRMVIMKLFVYGLPSFNISGTFEYLKPQLACASLTITGTMLWHVSVPKILFTDMGVSHDLESSVLLISTPFPTLPHPPLMSFNC